MEDEMYKQFILSTYAHLQNKHDLVDETHVAKGYNATCGDVITLHLKIDAKSVIKDASFTGEGCVLSQVSAEMVTQYVKGKRLDDIGKFSLENLLDMIGIHPSPARMKCIELSLITVKKIH